MILYTLDIKKSILTYLVPVIVLIIINSIYSLFSHNVKSSYMTYMFIYPLIEGILINLFIIINKKIVTIKSFNIGKIVLNYGVSTLVAGSFIKGIFEIAGTNSRYLIYYLYIGIILVVIGVLTLSYSMYLTINNKI